MTDPTPQTTPTRDEAVLLPCPFCGSQAEIERYGDGGKSTIYQCTYCSCSLETGEEWDYGRGWNKRASAPAPASGGVDAGRVTLFSALEAAYIRGAAWCAEMGMTHTFSELRKAAYDYADKEEKDVICREVRASLSPAATPVSEAGGEATGKPSLQVGSIPRAVNTGRYLAETNDGRLLYLNHANEWQEMPNILAKPASSPAGGDVVREALQAAEPFVELLHSVTNEKRARAIVWKALKQVRAALSQSTSAGRG